MSYRQEETSLASYCRLVKLKAPTPMIPSKRIVVREHACLILSKDASVAAVHVGDLGAMVAAFLLPTAVCLEYARTLRIAKKLEKHAVFKPWIWLKVRMNVKNSALIIILVHVKPALKKN